MTLKETADEAVAQCPSVEHVLVHRAPRPRDPVDGGARPLVARGRRRRESTVRRRCRSRPTGRASSSTRRGRPGRPKGAVLTHGGFLIKTAHDFAYCMDVGEQRPAVLADRPRLAHGADGSSPRALLPRRHRRAVRGRAGLSRARPAVGARRAPPHQRAGHLAHGGAGAHAARPRAGARPRSLVAPHPRLHRRAVEPGALPLALRARRARDALPIINYTGGTEISGGILGCFPIAPDQALLVRGPDPGHGRRVLRRGRHSRCAGRWASW